MGELVGPQVKHIDFLRRTVKVGQQVQRASPGAAPDEDEDIREAAEGLLSEAA